MVYKVKVGKKVKTKRVKADTTKTWTTTGPHRAVAKLMLGNRVLAKKRIPSRVRGPRSCPRRASATSSHALGGTGTAVTAKCVLSPAGLVIDE